MKFKREISVIIPTYNEADNICELIAQLETEFKKQKYKFELIIVDDHSNDGTVELARQALSKKNGKVLLKKGKQGKAYSLIEGIEHAVFENIGFIDADLQYPVKALAAMSDLLKDNDIVVANRKTYKDSSIRKTLSRVFRFGFGKTLFGLDTDIQAGLKVFKKEVFQSINFLPASKWTFDLEFLHRANKAGYTIQNFDIVFEKRTEGKSKVGIIKTAFELAANALLLRASRIGPVQIKPDEKSMKGSGLAVNGKKIYNSYRSFY